MNAIGQRPAEICRALLAALDASEGRRKRRQRNTTPDAIGLSIKRALLERAVDDDPATERFEKWLADYCAITRPEWNAGAVRAMALQVLEDWRLAQQITEFKNWLEQGAPSEDKHEA